MQVSWIDEEQLKGLLDGLAPPSEQKLPSALAWEWSTLPEEGLFGEATQSTDGEAVELDGAFAIEGGGTDLANVHRSFSEEEVPTELPMTSNELPELTKVRELLRSLRQRAEAGGLLRPQDPSGFEST